jgi:AcrR family transcriptional regulator
MGRPRVHDEATVVRLTDAAEQLLKAGGVTALSVRGVADAAKATTRAVYSVFGSKEEMVRALYRRGQARFVATLATAPEHDDPFENLMALTVSGFRAFARAEPHLYRLIFERPLPDFSPTADDRLGLREALGALRGRTARIAEAGLAGGRDPLRLAVEWTAVVQGLVSAELNASPPEAGDEAIFRDVLCSLVEGWRTPPVRSGPIPR